jgi:hypothetical protein
MADAGRRDGVALSVHTSSPGGMSYALGRLDGGRCRGQQISSSHEVLDPLGPTGTGKSHLAIALGAR